MVSQYLGRLNSSRSSEVDQTAHNLPLARNPTLPETTPAKRRRRARKSRDEMESQRMTHIAVERNRRRQMNEYLSVLRSMTPDSHTQRADQASIIGGAINYVRELEQCLQYLGTKHETKRPLPFSEFFNYLQYSMDSGSYADVEVMMAECHVSIKIQTKRRPKQLLLTVSGLQSQGLTLLHLSVTTLDQIVMYSLSVKVEDECLMSSVDEIATAVHDLVARIQQEDTLT